MEGLKYSMTQYNITQYVQYSMKGMKYITEHMKYKMEGLKYSVEGIKYTTKLMKYIMEGLKYSLESMKYTTVSGRASHLLTDAVQQMPGLACTIMEGQAPGTPSLYR